jgi:hypothetical protein
MSESRAQTRRPRPRWRRILMNILLLPPALLYVIIENVFWAGAKGLLYEAAKVPVVGALQRGLERLPAAAVLPLFLIPEILSHLGGLWATVLLVQRKFFLAFMVGLFIKGIATLMTVWIYQSCTTALLSVKWFAWVHGKAMQGRDWVAERIKPARLLARRLIKTGRSSLTRRFRALRALIAQRLGVKRK